MIRKKTMPDQWPKTTHKNLENSGIQGSEPEKNQTRESGIKEEELTEGVESAKVSERLGQNTYEFFFEGVERLSGGHKTPT